MTQGHFEAKKHAYRQTQDGIVVSFVIHPDDLNADFAVAALGTRYMVAFAQIGDDGKPVTSGPAQADRERTPFGQMKLAQQAGMRCTDADFQRFLNAKSPEEAADEVRKWCNVSSRADIKPGTPAGGSWLRLEQVFQMWLADQRYAEAATR